jgi:hypothetical protein
MNESLWSRAIRAVDARGLLPHHRSPLTPREVAARAEERGEVRLRLLVDGWYYPRSYGRIDGALSDEEANGIVTALETETEMMKPERAREEAGTPVTERSSKPRYTYCDLCGRALIPG